MRSGLDYFALDVVGDTKIQLIEAEFGLMGFGVVVKLFQMIYGGGGYFAPWDEEVSLLFARKSGLEPKEISRVFSAVIKREIFSKSMYEKYGILTSRGVQKRYFEAVKRRKEVEVIREYLLVPIQDLSKNVHIIGENVDIEGENSYISKQSKVKESKGKESKAQESDFLAFWAAYPKKSNKAAAQRAFEEIGVGEELLKKILRAVEEQKNTPQWEKEEGRYIPYPANWLSGKRWQDEVPKANVEDLLVKDMSNVPIFVKE
ncbi:MAG: DUF4373 domain-containing protein [Oscillospiraceae bacterium]